MGDEQLEILLKEKCKELENSLVELHQLNEVIHELIMYQEKSLKTTEQLLFLAISEGTEDTSEFVASSLGEITARVKSLQAQVDMQRKTGTYILLLDAMGREAMENAEKGLDQVRIWQASDIIKAAETLAADQKMPVSDSALRSALRRLWERGLIEKGKHGTYTITDEGLQHWQTETDNE